MSESIPCSAGCLPSEPLTWEEKPRPHGLLNTGAFTVTSPTCLASCLQYEIPLYLYSKAASGLLPSALRFGCSQQFSCLQPALGAPFLHHTYVRRRRWHSLWCEAKWLSCLCETKEPTQWDNTVKYENLQTPNLLFLLLSVDYFQQQGWDHTRDIKWRHSTPLVHPLGFFWLQK